MTKIPWTAERVVTAILSRGYQRVSSQNSTLWFMSPESTSEAAQYLALEYKPRAKAYAVHFGVSCKGAREKITQVETRLRSLTVTKWPPPDTPCWTLFDVGRALDWGYLTIPDPTQAVGGAEQFAQLCERILGPFLESVTTCKDVLRFLLRTEKPFEWGVTNPIRRATEVIATTMVAGLDPEWCKLELLKYQSSLHAGMRVGPQWRDSLDVLAAILTVAFEAPKKSQ